jgi:esterase/lipase superfamily enzyme
MRCVVILFFTIGLLNCGAKKPTPMVEKSPDDSLKKTPTVPLNSLPKDTIVKIGKTPVWIQSPEGEIKADILILPGWNFAKEKINKESDFCKKALANGYRLILPEMMKSVYASEYFKETREDYTSHLTLTWVTDTMIPTLQKEYEIFSGKKNYVHGISTGSRGAALVHLNTGNLFTKVVLLSGDFDQTQMPGDHLMKNTYGPYSNFKQRWETVDNPTYLSTQWTADLYIAHGTADEVVPVTQSQQFADKIEKEHPQCKVIKHFPSANHDFTFWGGETDAILKFFEE